VRDKVTQIGIENLTRIINKDSERGYTAHAHVHRLLSQFGYWPLDALESNSPEILTLRIIRHASTIPGHEFENLPPLHLTNSISTSIRDASRAVDNARGDKRTTLQGQVDTKECDKLGRQQSKPVQSKLPQTPQASRPPWGTRHQRLE
jgi:hypothetical protein